MHPRPPSGERETLACPRCGAPQDWRGICPACVLGTMIGPGPAPAPAAPADAGTEAAPDARMPREFAGRFEILEEIGVGGSGRVWRARQRDLAREVALKTLRFGSLSQAGDDQRLRREAQVAARLRHPGIVVLHEVGEADGEPYLVMELVRGESLAQRLRAGPLTPHHAATLVRDLADAVAHAHQAQVIHRDLKPSNVLLDADRGGAPRLTDFGIARLLGDPHAQTVTGEGLGTASYLAPEQASLQRGLQGPATDVYGLGAVLFHCLTGRAPFVGDSAAAVVRAVIEKDPPAPRALNPTIPRDLETVCLRALEKEPRRRFPRVEDLRADLDRFLSGRPVLARPVGMAGRAWRWSSRHPELSGAFALALALLLALAWVRERSQRQLARTVTQLELQRAAVLFRDGQVAEAMAQLASTARRDPASPVTAARLWSALRHRPWIRPLGQLNDGTNLVARLGADPDGEWVAWSPRAGEIEVRHAATWEPRGPRRPFPSYPVQVGVAPGARLAFVLGADGRLEFWEPRTGTPLPLPPGLADSPVLAVATADASGLAAAATQSGDLWVFPPGSPESGPQRLPHGRDLASAQFSASGDRLVSWGRDGHWKLWDPARAASIAEGRVPPPTSLESAHLSPNGRWLVIAAGDGALALHDARDGRPAGTYKVEGRPTGVAFATRLDRVLTSDIGGGVQLLEIGDGWRPLARWSAPSVVAALHRESRGDRVVGCTTQGQWRVWDLAAARPASEWFSHGHGTRGAVFVAGDRELLTLSRENDLRRWRLSPIRPFEEAALEAPGFWNDYAAQRIAFGPDHQCVIAARSAQALVLAGTPDTPLRTNALLTRPQGLIEHVALARDRILAWSPLHPDALVWKLGRPDPERLLASAGQRVSAAAWMPGPGDITLALADGRLQLHPANPALPPQSWETPTFRSLPPEVNPDGSPADNNLRRGESHRFSQLSPSPDGQWLAAVGTDHAVHRWSVASRRLAGPPIPFAYIATGVAWTPDSEAFAVATWAYYARVFSARTGQPLGPELGHKDGVSHVAFSPDGLRLVTASLDGSARVWNWRTGEPVGQPLAHDADVSMATFSPDGRWILTSSVDGTARVWDARSGLPASEALSVLGPPERSARDSMIEARFTPDGLGIVTLHRSGRIGLYTWDLPQPPVPVWATLLAESLGGQRLNPRGLTEAAPGLPVRRPVVGGGSPGWAAWLDRVYRVAESPAPPGTPASP